jgi:arginyl-tRNA synthetase
LGKSLAQSEGNKYLLVPEAERAATFAHLARDEAVALQRRVLERLGVRFDVWTSESALKNEGRIDNALKKLRERGLIEERDGAQWLRTTQFGDEADRVLVRSNGRPTYLASDIAYHIFKNERGFHRLLNVWTGEHKPYIERTRAALQASGCDAEKLEVLTCESARLLRDSRPISRGANGDSFSLDEALNTLDSDTLRFYFVRQSMDERVAIDDEIARRDNETNPAYAVRLLPSRLQTIIGEMQSRGAAKANEYSNEEREVVRLVALWPDTVANAAEERAPHRVASFLLDLSNATREVLKASRPDAPGANVEVLQAAQVVVQNALSILGMSGGRI